LGFCIYNAGIELEINIPIRNTRAIHKDGWTGKENENINSFDFNSY